MPLLPSELQGRARRPTRGAGGGAGRQSRKDTRRVVRLVLANLALVALLYWMLFARGGSTSASSRAPARHRYSNGWMSRKEILGNPPVSLVHCLPRSNVAKTPDSVAANIRFFS